MYSPLNEDFMFQAMKDRTDRLSRTATPRTGERVNRRWWRVGARRAG